mmetsp:Transcript_23443/g.28665  ORF Transcript_23443/g.28665 Transcript_23443/m.28665 type:complete len:125 (-) Transcript_23443:88-462(-)
MGTPPMGNKCFGGDEKVLSSSDDDGGAGVGAAAAPSKAVDGVRGKRRVPDVAARIMAMNSGEEEEEEGGEREDGGLVAAMGFLSLGGDDDAFVWIFDGDDDNGVDDVILLECFCWGGQRVCRLF